MVPETIVIDVEGSGIVAVLFNSRIDEMRGGNQRPRPNLVIDNCLGGLDIAEHFYPFMSATDTP